MRLRRAGGEGPGRTRPPGITARTGRRLRAPGDTALDEGFSLVELLVALLITAIILPITFVLVRNLSEQSVVVSDTLTATQQAQTAANAIVDYTHGGTTVLPDSTANCLDLRVQAGWDTTNQIPDLGTLTSQLEPPGETPPSTPGCNVSAPACTPGSCALVTTLYLQGEQPTTEATTSAEPTADVFTYDYYVNGNAGSTSSPGNVPVSGFEFTDIVAVGINVTFLTGPRTTIGYNAIRPTAFSTTIYLQNSTGEAAPSTTTSLAPSATPVQGQQDTFIATVQTTGSTPDAGTVTFAVGPTSSSESVVCSNVPISDGIAECTWTPGASGSPETYQMTASYSGDTSFLASSTTLTFNAEIPTTIQFDSSYDTHTGQFWTVYVYAEIVNSLTGQPVPDGQVEVAFWACPQPPPIPASDNQVGSPGCNVKTDSNIAVGATQTSPDGQAYNVTDYYGPVSTLGAADSIDVYIAYSDSADIYYGSVAVGVWVLK